MASWNYRTLSVRSASLSTAKMVQSFASLFSMDAFFAKVKIIRVQQFFARCFLVFFRFVRFFRGLCVF